MPPHPYWAANYVYDHIRFLDTAVRYKLPQGNSLRDYFFDPLVSYRSAGLAVERREFPRAIHILDEAIKFKFMEKFAESDVENLRILNHARFERRCAQYHWLAYLSNRRENANHLFDAVDRLKSVLAMNVETVVAYRIAGLNEVQNKRLRLDILESEQRSALLSFVIYNFYRYILGRDGFPNWDGFSAEVGSFERMYARLLPGIRDGGATEAASKSYDRTEKFAAQRLTAESILEIFSRKRTQARKSIDAALTKLNDIPRRFVAPLDRRDVAGEIRQFLSDEVSERA
jgi:hypothetical protein